MAENDKKSTSSRKRFDFGIVKKIATKRPAENSTKRSIETTLKTPSEKAPKMSSEALSKTPPKKPLRTSLEAPSKTSSKTPSKTTPVTPPEKPSRSPMTNRGRFIDFAPVRPTKDPAPVAENSPVTEPVSVKASVTKNTITVGKVTNSRRVEENLSQTEAPRQHITSRGLRIDFVRKPAVTISKPSTHTTPIQPKSTVRITSSSTTISPSSTVADVLGDTPDEPLMSDSDLAAALAGFADATPVESDYRSTTSSKDRYSTGATPGEDGYDTDISSINNNYNATPEDDSIADFTDELDAFDELSDDILAGQSIGDDIDRIEAEIEAEANDFVKEPKPLFEDPLVKISKVREEREHEKEAAEAARFKAEVKEQAREAAKRSPYAALYSTVDGRSPFLTTVNVEKRPLSASTSVGELSNLAKPKKAKPTNSSNLLASSHSKDDRFSTLAPLKNSYRNRMKKQLEDDAKVIHRETMIISAPEVKGHNIALIAGILLTILLGAGVGLVVYLVFFQ